MRLLQVRPLPGREDGVGGEGAERGLEPRAQLVAGQECCWASPLL